MLFLFPLFFSPPCEGYELEVSKPRVIIKTVDGINLFDQAEIPIDALREIIVNRFAHANPDEFDKMKTVEHCRCTASMAHCFRRTPLECRLDDKANKER